MGKKTFETTKQCCLVAESAPSAAPKVPPGRPSQENANAHATDEVAEIVPVTKVNSLGRAPEG